MTLLLLSLLGCPKPGVESVTPANDPAGDWGGTLNTGMGSLRLIFHIAPAEDGWTGSFDSLDQGAEGIPMQVFATEDGLRFEAKLIGGTYDGHWAGPDALEGSWSQGRDIPLRLERGLVPEKPGRPQDPTPPFPYRTDDLSVSVGDHTLGCTLILPEGEGPFPAVVMISGSGPQNRDEELADHRPFAVLADHLARRGIASLRCDDRGIGESTGVFQTATTRDHADDAAAAALALRERPEIGRLGLLGHSEGGWIAPLAAPTAKPDFLVLLAPAAVSFLELIPVQGEAIRRVSGVSDEENERSTDISRRAMARAAAGGEGMDDAIRAILREEPELASAPPTAIDAQLGVLKSPWMQWALNHDPAEALATITVPTLGLFGSLDLQVLPSQNREPLERALARVPHQVTVLEGLNHLFQPAATGSPDEYAAIETTMAPEAMEAVASWILALPETP